MQTEAGSHSEGGSRPAPPAEPRAAARPQPGELSWALVGALSGVLGALAIAVFFLAADVSARQALWTPTALGSIVFLGERIAEDAAPRPVLVLGYTAVHGTFFLSIGLMAAFALVRHERLRLRGAIALAVLLFAAFEILILGFLQFASPGLVGTFGAVQITAANLLASGAMAAFLTRMAPRIGP